MKPKSKIRSSLLLALGAATLAISSASAQLYWDSNSTTDGAGATPTGTWGVDNYWNTDSIGGAGTFSTTTLITSNVFFSAGADAVNPYTVGLNSATQNARLVTFEDGTATLNSGTLSLGNGGGITVASNTVTGATLSSGLTLSGAQTFNVAASRTLTLDTGTFTRNAGATLNVLSTGTVTTTMTGLDSASLVNGIVGPWASHGSGASTKYATIDGSNNIVGLTGTAAATAANVTSTLGTFNYDMAGGNAAFGVGANINTLRYTGGGATITNGLTTKGIMNVGGNALVFSGAITAGASGQLAVNSANGNIQFTTATGAGAYDLVKTGSGRLELSNATQGYTGNVIVNGGILSYGDDIGRMATAAGNITINDGVIDQRWQGAITRTLGSGAGQIQILGGASGLSNNNGSHTVTFNNNASFEVVWGSAFFNPSTYVLGTQFTQNNNGIVMANLYGVVSLPLPVNSLICC